MHRLLFLVMSAGLVFGLFLFINIIHFQYFEVSVIFYACLADMVLSLIISAPLIYWLSWRFFDVTKFEVSLTLLLSCSLIIHYALLGPTIIDRSLSGYILEKLHQRGGEIAVDKVPDVFVQEYMPEYRLVDVRLTEQLTSRTAIIEDGCLILTPRGRFVAQTLNAYRRVFTPRKRVLMGEVTDQLTRPFDDALQVVDVTCNEHENLEPPSTLD